MLRPVLARTADNSGTRDWPSIVRTARACLLGDVDLDFEEEATTLVQADE